MRLIGPALTVSAPLLAANAPYVNPWAHVRGVNYVPSYSRNPVQTWIDWDLVTIERELDLAQSLYLNAVRVFLHLFAWAADRPTFLSRYESFVVACAKRSIRPMIVLFDDDFFDVPGIATEADAKAWVASQAYRTSDWMANPGMPWLAADAAESWPLVRAFLADVVRDDPRLLAYDIMNEPGRNASFEGGLPTFIEFALNVTQRRSGGNVPTTVDDYTAVPATLPHLEGALSYHNYYHYSQWQDCTANQSDVYSVQAAAATTYFAAAAALNKPVLVSEFGQSDCYCPAAMALQDAGVGWIAWELILSHDQFGDFQGLLYANGTARSTAEVACLKALARRRPRAIGAAPSPRNGEPKQLKQLVEIDSD